MSIVKIYVPLYIHTSSPTRFLLKSFTNFLFTPPELNWVESSQLSSIMAFQKIKVANPIVEMDGQIFLLWSLHDPIYISYGFFVVKISSFFTIHVHRFINGCVIVYNYAYMLEYTVFDLFMTDLVFRIKRLSIIVQLFLFL